MKRSVKKKVKKRDKLPTVQHMRKKCDSLLTPIVKVQHPYCFLGAPNCAGVTQVAHHHVHKSKSTALRYDMDNLIPLCHHCHLVLHNNESYWASVIVTRKGTQWFEDLNKRGQEVVKSDVHFYIENHKRLSALLQSLQ